MGKSLLYRWFGTGKVPKKYREQIEREGVLLSEEGIGGSITFINFRSPTRRSGWRRTWFLGSIVLTEQHFLAFGFTQPVIGVGWNDDVTKKLTCSVEKRERLCVAYDASTFNDDWSGDIEVRFSTPRAAEILRDIQDRIGRTG